MKQEQINRHEILNKITPLVENTAMRFNLIPIEIDFSKENHRWFLRIFLFSYERPVTIDDCENVTRSINDFLEELIPVKYFLEVSSPGLDRKFKSDKEFLIFKGKEITLKLKKPLEEDGENGEKVFQAIIEDFDKKEGLKILRSIDENEFIIKRDNIISAKLFFDEKKIEDKQ
jgi:ribosome maturation factor RimP